MSSDWNEVVCSRFERELNVFSSSGHNSQFINGEESEIILHYSIEDESWTVDLWKIPESKLAIVTQHSWHVQKVKETGMRSVNLQLSKTVYE